MFQLACTYNKNLNFFRGLITESLIDKIEFDKLEPSIQLAIEEYSIGDVDPNTLQDQFFSFYSLFSSFLIDADETLAQDLEEDLNEALSEALSNYLENVSTYLVSSNPFCFSEINRGLFYIVLAQGDQEDLEAIAVQGKD